MGDDLHNPHGRNIDRLPGSADTFASAGNWRADELSAVLQHQLDAPLAADLYERLPTDERQRLSDVAAAATPPVESFRDLLFHPEPPEELSSLVHAFAQRPATARRAGLPAEVARVLDVAMAAAQRRRGKAAGSVATADLRWLAELDWAEPAVRQLAEAAMASWIEALPEASLDTRDASSSASDTLVRTVPDFAPSVDGYAVTGRLGEGGMGVVWRAEQLSTGRMVALKLMSVASFGSERARLRFEREVRLTTRLEHQQIARVYESGLHRGAYYYAMELVEGTPLDRYVGERNLNERAILELMRSVCAPVGHAHRLGIVHRDLKPNNILVDAAGVPHVLDFGLAKAIQDAQTSGPAVTMDGDFAGTPAFMAPEQAAGSLDSCDTTTDVYALGVVLFHLLTGVFPHDLGGSRLEVLRRRSETQPRRLLDVRPDADRKLDGLLTRALSQQPENRYATAGELGEAIDCYLAGGGEATPAPRRPRRRALLLMTTAVVVLAAVLAVGWWWTRPSAPIPAGPWVAAPVYASPGRPHVLQLNPGKPDVATVQAWRIDWGTGEPLEHLPADARAVEHIYPEPGRFKIRVQVKVRDIWHLASTGNGALFQWSVAEGGNGHYYTLTRRRGSWNDALDESWSRQAGLVSINSAAEQRFLDRMFLAGDAEGYEWYWIGLTERALHRFVGGSYIWLDDSTYEAGYKNWAPGRPADPAPDNSASMNHAYANRQPDAKPGQWSDLRDQDVNSSTGGARGIIEFTHDPPNELLTVVSHSATSSDIAAPAASSQPAAAHPPAEQ